MIIILGYTESDLPDYSSFGDGYRPGAAQTTIDVPIEGELSGHDGVAVADAVFVACQFGVHEQPPGGLAGVIYRAFHEVVERIPKVTGRDGREYIPVRSFSVGDTVTLKGRTRHETWACAPFGFDRVEPALGCEGDQ